MTNYVDDKETLLGKLRSKFGDHLNRRSLVTFCEENDIEYPHWLVNDVRRKIARGVYSLETLPEKKRGRKVSKKVAPVKEELPKQVETQAQHVNSIQNVEVFNESLVPDVDQLFVKWGAFADVLAVIQSNEFCNMFITGLSGNGKTLMVEQACAKAKRELFRVNITEETDEDDLIGGFRLVNGETQWFDGPVVRAMKRGGVLLLDEVDLASTKIMCLQPILEGKGLLLKKINQFVKPAKGFTVVATANTKGKGNENGQFIGTNILNEAFLERFPLTFEQPYAKKTTEKNILKKVLRPGKLDKEFVESFTDHLVEWSQQSRKAYDNDGCDEIISTRRLVHIANAFMIFNRTLKEVTPENVNSIKYKAVELCVARFDQTTKETFMQLFKNMDPQEKLRREEEAKKRQEELEKQEMNKDTELADILGTQL